MSTTENENHAEPGTPGGKQTGSQVLIGFCVVVLVLLAVVLNNADQAAEMGHRLFGWRTPKQQCIDNLKHMEWALEQWGLEYKKVWTNTYSLTDTTLLSYFKGSALPFCPMGGKYSAGTNVMVLPRCSIPGHTL